MSRVFLFEDDEHYRKEIEDYLKLHLGEEAEIASFNPRSAPEVKGEPYERDIERKLCKNNSIAPIGLIACDKELGLYKNYPGLSAHAISIAARNLGLPFCQYSRRPKGRELDRYVALQRWDSEDVTLTGSGSQEWTKEMAILLQGFETIQYEYVNRAMNNLDPSVALAAITGRESAANRIALYGSGDRSVMSEIFTFIVSNGQDNQNAITQRIPRVLGSWLYLSLLRFPGLMVNNIACASYLNIDQSEFSRRDVQEPFDEAIYSGPFASLGQWWWRDGLDYLLADSGASDGREFLRSSGIDVNACLDKDTGLRAGYYCMITQQPVSLSNSKGNINWFPAGADLARIRKSTFEQITSLVGT